MLYKIGIILVLVMSGCRTVPNKADCAPHRCMPEEHDVRYWRF